MKPKGARNSENQCLGCSKHVTNADDLSVCTGCFEASFCNKECQKRAWATHRLDCLPCQICGKRIPGVPVHRDCACESKQGDSHIACIVNAAAEDSGGNEWDHTSTLWETCKHCKQSYTGETKQVLEKERTVRIEKAKERLHDLVVILQRPDEEDDESSFCLDGDDYIRISGECIVLYRGIYGEDDWSSAEIFWAHYYLGGAFIQQKRYQEAQDTLELATTKLEKQQKFKGWNTLSREISMELAQTYLIQSRYYEALSLFEEAYEKFYKYLPDWTKLWVRYSLALCYQRTRSWKKARELVEQACVQSKQVHGHENVGEFDFITLREVIVQLSYNTAETIGIEGILDGTIVEIDGYNSYGYFDVSVLNEKSLGDDDVDDNSCESDQLLTVPVEQVIMVPDSDVVLHSLKGAKHLNGKLGVVVEFNHEIGRYVIIVEGSSKTVNVKPDNILPAYMGCEKEKMIARAKELSNKEG